jgi:hypothetical protein
MLKKMTMLMEGAGEGGGSWRDALPENLRNDPSIATFKDVSALVQSHIETKALVGKSIRPLGQTATAEEKKQYVEKLLQADPALVYAPDGDEEASKRLMRRLGRPEKPEEYVFDDTAVTAAGLKPDELRALAVTTGLTKTQAAALAKVMVDANMEAKRVLSVERQALDQEWGAAKEERVLAAKAAAMKMGLHEVDVAGLTPKQLKAFYGVSKAIGVQASEFREHGAGLHGARLSPSEAQLEMQSIMGRKEYFNPKPAERGEHEKLKARVAQLMPMAYPEG